MRAPPVLNSGAFGYFVGFIAGCVGLILQATVRPYIDFSHYMLLYPVVFALSWFAGFGPGVVATLVSVMGVSYFFVDQITGSQMLRILVFGGTGVFISYANGKMRQQKERAELIERDLNHKVTSLELARRQIEQSEQEFRAFFELAGNGSAQVDPNTFRYLRINQKYCDITGYTKEELFAMPDYLDVTHEEDRKRERNTYLDILRDPRKNDWVSEKRYVRKNGEIAWVIITGTVRRDEAGRCLYCLATVQDITERKKTEEALKESEAIFKKLATAIPQMVWITDDRGPILYFNEQWYRYTGSSPEESLHNGWISAIHPDDVDRLRKQWHDSILSGQVYQSEARIRNRFGDYHWFLNRAYPIQNRDGKVTQWFGTSTDIENQKQVEHALQDTIHARDEFLSIASHEFKTPITSLKLQIQMAIRQWDNALTIDLSLLEQMKQAFKFSLVQVDSLTRLVNDLLDITRMTMGKLKLQMEEVSVYNFMNEVVGRLENQLRIARCATHVTVPEGLRVTCDKSRMDQVITNLLTNAAKFGAGRPIFVSVCRKKRLVRFIVRDFGSGIPKEKQEKIFERFERAVSGKNIVV